MRAIRRRLLISLLALLVPVTTAAAQSFSADVIVSSSTSPTSETSASRRFAPRQFRGGFLCRRIAGRFASPQPDFVHVQIGIRLDGPSVAGALVRARPPASRNASSTGGSESTDGSTPACGTSSRRPTTAGPAIDRKPGAGEHACIGGRDAVLAVLVLGRQAGHLEPLPGAHENGDRRARQRVQTRMPRVEVPIMVRLGATAGADAPQCVGRCTAAILTGRARRAVRGYLLLRKSRRIASSASMISSRVARPLLKLSLRLNALVGGRNANT